jgi:hypothetical protein
MFRKIVSNLAFSPALVGQLGFYAKRLRKEEATRRVGLVFVALALIVQSFAVFTPPESANAADADNIIYSGIRNKADLLAIYDRGTDSAGRHDIQQIYNHFGVTRADLANTTLGSYNTNDFNGAINTLGRSNWGVSNRHAIAIPGTTTTVYTGGFLDGYNSKKWPMPALIGKRAVDGAWFAITLSCGNLVYTTMPPAAKPLPPPPVKLSPTPVAACSALKITSIDRTNVKLDATATLGGGATISDYTYIIKDAKGATILDRTVPTTGTSSSIQQALTKDGSYTASVTVATSTGAKTGPSCTANFIVSPEPLCTLTPTLVQSSPDCKPCLNDSSIWYKDATCKPTFELSKRVRNVTQGLTDATSTTARPGDQLQYTLSVKNVGNDTGSYTMTDNVEDILQYADLVDAGDGRLVTESAPNVLSPATIVWPAFTAIKPGAIIERTLLVKIKPTIPATAINTSNQRSYDCTITNTFGNTLNVGVACPPEKVVEQIATELPHTGPNENMIFSGIVLAVVVYFYARSRQTSKEIRLIRRDFNAGTI